MDSLTHSSWPPPYSETQSSRPSPWHQYWARKVKLRDGSIAYYRLWFCKVDQRPVHGWSYSSDATRPEYHIACRKDQGSVAAAELTLEVLQTFLKHRASARCELSFQAFLLDIAYGQASHTRRRHEVNGLFVLDNGPPLDGVPHFTSETLGEHSCMTAGCFTSFRYLCKVYRVLDAANSRLPDYRNREPLELSKLAEEKDQVPACTASDERVNVALPCGHTCTTCTALNDS